MALTRSNLKTKATGALIGGAIGDAMGLPVECKSPHFIQQNCGFIDAFIDNHFHKHKSVARRGPGTVSDDTQLSRAIIDSLMRRCGYDINDIKKAHIEAYEGKWGKAVGWGASTRKACEKIKNGEKVTLIPEAAGNGPVIKIAPLAIYSCFKTLDTSHGKFTDSFNASLLKKCKEITEISHGDPRCIVAAYCHARCIIRTLQDEILPENKPKIPQTIASTIIEDAEYAESKLGCDRLDLPLLSARLKDILTNKNFQRETYLISIDIATEQSSFVYNSYPMVAYCVSKYLPYQNFRYGVTMTINAGADADSNGSMVGTVLGAQVGFYAINKDYVKGIRGWRDLLIQVKKFVNLI